MRIAGFCASPDFFCDCFQLIVDMSGVSGSELLFLWLFPKMVNQVLILELTARGAGVVVWGCCGVCSVRFVSDARPVAAFCRGVEL